MRSQALYDRFLSLSRNVDARTARLQAALVARMRELAASAGLDSHCPAHHAHNAIVSRDHGSPWPEVNYQKAREILHLEQKGWAISRLGERIVNRAYHAWIDAMRSE